jgi:hypothetical protein
VLLGLVAAGGSPFRWRLDGTQDTAQPWGCVAGARALAAEDTLVHVAASLKLSCGLHSARRLASQLGVGSRAPAARDGAPLGLAPMWRCPLSRLVDGAQYATKSLGWAAGA